MTITTKWVESSQEVTWMVTMYKGRFICNSWWSWWLLLGHVCLLQVEFEVLELTCFTLLLLLLLLKDHSILGSQLEWQMEQIRKRRGVFKSDCISFDLSKTCMEYQASEREREKKWQQQRTYNTLQWAHLKFLHLVPSLMHDLIHNPINSYSSQPHWLLWFILLVFTGCRVKVENATEVWSCCCLLLLLRLVMSKDQLDRKSGYESVASASADGTGNSQILLLKVQFVIKVSLFSLPFFFHFLSFPLLVLRINLGIHFSMANPCHVCVCVCVCVWLQLLKVKITTTLVLEEKTIYNVEGNYRMQLSYT